MPRVIALVLFVLALAGGVLAVPAARSASPDVVLSQIYAGGGNAGASFANDYVELFNRGSSSIDVGGWTIQYASAAGTTWQATALAGSIAPGRRYLVQLASAAAVGAPLPTPDAAGTTNLAVSGGKVALVRDATPLTCGATPGSCSAVTAVADLVGYGTAADYEGSAAPAIGNTTAAIRAGDGCADTDANATDFAAADPSPRNSTAAATACGGAQPPPPGGSVSQAATVEINVQSSLSIALERPTVSFGNAATGTTPSPVSERVTVVSNNAAGYTLTARRTAFTPADLPLGIGGSAPAGGQIGPALAGGTIAALPIGPAPDLLVGTKAAQSVAGGDVWDTRLGFVSPLPAVPPGRYAATVTLTVIGR